MINSAQLVRFSKQITSYDIAARNFKTKYGELPGDYPKIQGDIFGTIYGNCNSDGNGYVMSDGGNSDTFYGEIEQYWNVLSTTQSLDKIYTQPDAVTPASIVAGTSVPKAEMGYGGQILVLGGNGPTYNPGFYWFVGNFYWIGAIDPSSTSGAYIYLTGNNNLGNFSAPQAASVDAKFDDGNAITGNIRASGNNARQNTAVDSNCADTGSGAYNLSSSVSYPCSMVIKLFSLGGGEGVSE